MNRFLPFFLLLFVVTLKRPPARKTEVEQFKNDFQAVSRRLFLPFLKGSVKRPKVHALLLPQVKTPSMEINTYGDIQEADPDLQPVVEKVQGTSQGGQAGGMWANLGAEAMKDLQLIGGLATGGLVSPVALMKTDYELLQKIGFVMGVSALAVPKLLGARILDENSTANFESAAGGSSVDHGHKANGLDGLGTSDPAPTEKAAAEKSKEPIRI